MSAAPEENRRLRALSKITTQVAARGVRGLDEQELVELPRLYRYASSVLARLETAGVETARQEELRVALARAHSILYRESPPPLTRRLAGAVRFLLAECPRAIRAEWKLLLAGALFLYGVAFGSWLLVRQDLGLAYTLFDPAAVSSEIAQIQETPADEAFVGNFTFEERDSSRIAGWILAHNMAVSVLFFASGLVPPLFANVLLTNALMLGTYTGVASHWGRAGEISSILWCHGVLEIQAILLAGIAGMILLRAWVAPGPWTRAHALRLEARQAWRLMAPVFPMLFCAGVIEGFVSPHASHGVRMATAIGTGVALVAWVLLGGRERKATGSARAA